MTKAFKTGIDAPAVSVAGTAVSVEGHTHAGGGGGAPTDATYVVTSSNTTLTNERVLTQGSYLTITDNGSSTVTIAVDATSANTASKVVARDASGNFSAGTITATLSGNASTASALSSAKTITLSGDVTGSVSTDLSTGPTITTAIGTGVIVDADISASAAIANSKLANSSITVNGTTISLGGSGTATAAAGTLTGTTLNSTVTASSLTSFGTSPTVTTPALTLSTTTSNTDGRIAWDTATDRITVGNGTSQSTFPNSGSIVNADISASAAIADSKLATISTAGKVSNSATTATNANTASAIVARDASGNFTAGTITAALTGTASGNLASTESWKADVCVATTANITLSGTQTIDGVAVVANDRVLVKDQTASSGAANGIYTVAAGAWSRATDSDTAAELAGAAVAISSGTTNGGSAWTTSFKSTDTLGTTGQTWYKMVDTSGAAFTGNVSTTGTLAATSTVSASGLAGSLLSAATPLANSGAGVVGTAAVPSRQDHQHPTTGLVPTTRTISTTAPLTGGGDLSADRTLAVSAGSTTAAGVLQLTDSTASTSTTTAATPNSVKSAYDLAAAAVPKSTVTTAGDLILATGSATVTRLAIGANGYVLTSDGTTATWAAPASSSTGVTTLIKWGL